ncbi:MAG: caspase family protein [Pirellulales bacterium]
MTMTRRECLSWSGAAALGASLPAWQPSPVQAQTGRQGLALCIALSYEKYDKVAYGGAHVPYLSGCLPDLENMTDIFHVRNLPVRQLKNADATRSNVRRWIETAADRLRSGDLFCVTYSGHGTRIRDTNGDEADDECWCLFDGLFLDDELGALWTRFREGVRIVVVSDSCHSGTILRDVIFNQSKDRVINLAVKLESQAKGAAAGEEVKKQLPRAFPDASRTRDLNFEPSDDEKKIPSASRALPEPARERLERLYGRHYRSLKQRFGMPPREADRNTKASVLLLAACQDEQTAADIGTNGLFTAVLKQQLQAATGYRRLLDSIRRSLERENVAQTPNFLTHGEPNTTFEREVPFTI